MRRWIWIAGLLLLLTGVPALGDADASWPLAFPDARAQTNVQITKQFGETTYYLRDVQLVTPEIGWAVGFAHWDQQAKQYVSTILKTTDAGNTWVPQAAAVAVDLNAVYFLDEQRGWAVGVEGTVLHTTDGGQHWQPQPVDTTAEFTGVAFADADHGWAVTTTPTTYDDFRDMATDWDATMWHTRDGGQSWQRQTLPDTASVLHSVEFVDAQNGWAVGAKRAGEDNVGRLEHAGVIYHTADGGVTWAEQYSMAERTFTKADFVDGVHGWVVGFPTSSGGDQRSVLHTTDGGQSWEVQEPGNVFAPLWDVQFIDQNRGYIVGADYVGAWGPPVMRTFDGGTTWEDVKMEKGNPLSVEGIYALEVIGDRVIAVGDHDYITTTERAWDFPEPDSAGTGCLYLTCLFEQHYLNPHYIFHSVFFVDEHQGWVVGSKTFGVSHWGQVVLHTTDGGQTWEIQYEHAPDPESLFSVHRADSVWFTDAQHGWVGGSSERFYQDGWQQYGALMYTTDGGQTWQDGAASLYRNAGEGYDREREFFAVEFADGQSGWALANRYVADPRAPATVALAHTADGGATWQWVDTGVEGMLSIGFAPVQGDVDFPDAQHGWAVGGQGQIVSTTDGGATWTQQMLTCEWPECPKRLFAVDMIDNQTGWIGGEGLYYTTDGGATWLQQEVDDMPGIPYPVDIYAMQFVDAQHGWLAGDRGALLRTTDGGASWERIETGTDYGLNGLYFVSAEQGWVVGNSGTILHVTASP